MCIIVYKPNGINFPGKKTLKNCFQNNNDGAGFMYVANDKVQIRKGFMTFDKFWKALKGARKQVGDSAPFVMHFRIGTQGANCQQLTHPFPLSANMKNLKKLEYETDFGIAHNGIISLTTNSKAEDSDTMIYITDVLVNIIKDDEYWWADDRNITLIENTAESKLCIMQKDHVELIGDFTLDNGVYYSNTSYKYSIYGGSYVPYNYHTYDYLYDDYMPKEQGDDNCFLYMYGDDTDCHYCPFFDNCEVLNSYYESIFEAEMEEEKTVTKSVKEAIYG